MDRGYMKRSNGLIALVTIIIGLTSWSCEDDKAEPDQKEYCIVWDKIKVWTQNDIGTNLTTEAGWIERVAITEELVASLPSEWKEIGEKYLVIVRARAELLASYDYISITELPADVRSAFISKHFDAQQEANTLIDFIKSECE